MISCGKIREGKSVTNAEDFTVVYGNVQITCVETEPGTDFLVIMVAYADRETQKIVYENVLYSQIDRSVAGKRIAIARELTPDELRNTTRQATTFRLIKDCGLSNTDALDEMAKRGYRFFTHYIVNEDELIIIAKGLSVND